MKIRGRRTIVILMSVALSIATTTLASGAQPRSAGRVEELPYDTPVVGIFTPAAHAWYFDCTKRVGCVILNIRKKDRYVSLKIKDATGLPVFAQVRNPHNQDVVAHVYGETEDPILVGGPFQLTVHILPGFAAPDKPSLPTNGIVEATFMRRPPRK